jgi:Lon protease-like protein
VDFRTGTVRRIPRRRDRVSFVLDHPLMNLPSVIPVMLLQQCNVFPHGLLPLYIFEPRYRAMLKHALQNDRMLCIGTLTPSEDEEAAESDDRIHEFSTAAVIRACVGNADGTSHLVLQGMQRVRFVSWEQYEPFRIARVEPVEDRTTDPAATGRKAQRMLAQVLGLIRQDSDAGRKLAGQLENLADPAHLADFVAGNLIAGAEARQPLLGMTDVGDRLDFLMDLLPAPGEKPAKP